MTNWLGLSIGNSRLHWAWFQGKILQETWDSQHLSNYLVKEQLLKEILPPSLKNEPDNFPIYIASVVSSQTVLWQAYPKAKLITLNQIPLKEIYPTMGIDRALALWGAGTTLGFPCLVIDAGTALTFTGANSDRVLVGGAILPGLRLQLQSLATKAAALPEVNLPQILPNRFALNTPEAIQSGVIYTILAGIKDFVENWLHYSPDSKVILTGGDAQLLHNYLQVQFPCLAERIIVDLNLIFWGMRSLVFGEQNLQS
jgi:type III pantothenate kinase